jgi:hypothetical protein
MEYVIKVYRIKNVSGKGYTKTWDLEYVDTLPYIFRVKSVNICNQMNIMFEGAYDHIISIK